MNPQYLPPSQFGGPPQGFAPGKQGPGVPQPGAQDSFAMNNAPGHPPPGGYLPSQSPFGYKGPTGSSNAQMPPLPTQMQGPPMTAPPSNLQSRPGGPQGMPSTQSNFNSQLPQLRHPGQAPLMSTGITNPVQIQNGVSAGASHSPQRQMGSSSTAALGGFPQMMPQSGLLQMSGPPPGPPQNIGSTMPPTNSQMGPSSLGARSSPGLMGQMPPQPTVEHMSGPPLGPPISNASGFPAPPTNQGSGLPTDPPNNQGLMRQMPPQNSGAGSILPPSSTGSGLPRGPPTNQGLPGQLPPQLESTGAILPPNSASAGLSGGLPTNQMPSQSNLGPPGPPPPTSQGLMGQMPPQTNMRQPGPSPLISSGPNFTSGPPTSQGMMGQLPPETNMKQSGPMPPISSGPPTSQGMMGQIPPQTNLGQSTPAMNPGSLNQMPGSSRSVLPAPSAGPPTNKGMMGQMPPQTNLGPTSPFTMSNLQSGAPTNLGGLPPPSLTGPNLHSAPPTSQAMMGQIAPSNNLGQAGLSMQNSQGYPPSNQPLQRGNLPANIPPGQYKPGPAGYMGMPPQFNQPSVASTYPPNPNQLANQMHDMNLGANRQFPMKPAMNGDNSPHMPPPLTQNRGPQAPMGYPPMPNQSQQMPSGPYPPQPTFQQTQQTRRLDPDQMPSPIEVTLEDQRTRSGIFCTNQKGLVPPLVSTTFITQDQGNAGPRLIRSTMYNVPTTSDMMKQTAVPFGLVISPLARSLDQEYPPPIVDFGEMGPVRCIRCKAYMSPFMQFIDAGKRFQCLFCKATTEVPADYFQHLDHTGQRVDRYERPELILGAYEFVATKDYCRNNTFPKPPAIVFIIDVSYNNVKSGLVHLLCAEMKEILKNLPVDQNQEKSKMKVGFITYNGTVHFYNIKGTLAQPQMMVVGDVQEMFMPLLDGFLCDIEESAAVIDSLMQQIPAMFAETRETETVLLPAIQAGLEALKASECAGKLLVFHSTLPTSEAPGRLKNRDERKLLGTEKERTVLTPQTQAYNQLGQDCVAAGCSVDLFITNNSYVDIATIGQVSRLTGGEVFKYTYFQADVDGERLINDVITDINRPVAFDSIMRVRTSTGVRPTDFYGHFYMSNTTDMEIAAIDCDKAVAVEIKHDDKLTEEDGVYIQVALLYTSCSGQRRLRILNLSLKTCSQMADLYRSCELDTVVNFFAKQCVYRLLENNPKAVKDSLVNRCAQMLACYRKNCASPSSAGQLILPECLKLLPLYVNCLLKSDAISGGPDMSLDDRSFVMQCVSIMDIPTSVVYFYPRLIPLHEIQNGSKTLEIPNSIRCTVEKMTDNGVYLLENGIHMLMWIGLSANQDWIQSVFGVSNAAQIDIDRLNLPEINNDLSLAIRNLVDQIRTQRHRCMRLTLVRQRDKLETVFRHFLMEDRGQDGSSSYVDFLCHMHKEIRQLLS